MSQPAIVPIQQPRKQQSNRVKKQNSSGAAAPAAEYALGQYTVDAFISPALPNANSKKVKNQQRQQQQQRSQSQRGAPANVSANANASPSKASPQKKSGDSAPVNTRHFAGAQFEISPDANQLPLPGALLSSSPPKDETAPSPAPAPAPAPAAAPAAAPNGSLPEALAHLSHTPHQFHLHTRAMSQVLLPTQIHQQQYDQLHQQQAQYAAFMLQQQQHLRQQWLAEQHARQQMSMQFHQQQQQQQQQQQFLQQQAAQSMQAQSDASKRAENDLRTLLKISP